MRGEWGLIFGVFFTLFDVVFTMRYWHLESNPLVLALGPGLFTIMKLALVVGLVWVWASIEGGDKTKTRMGFVIWSYAVLMAAAAIINVIQLLGFRF